MRRSIQPLRYFFPLTPYPRIIYHDVNTTSGRCQIYESRIPVKNLTGEYMNGFYIHSTDPVRPGDDMSLPGIATRGAFWATLLASSSFELTEIVGILATCDIVYCNIQRKIERDAHSEIIF
jgi:hypothetical protein